MSCIYAALIAVTLLSANGSVTHDNCLLQKNTGKIRGDLFQSEDTGSDAVIVPSCICSETPGAGCERSDKCFRGTNKSSTFSIAEISKVVSITFGSGTIQAAVAKDVVSVGDFKVTMDDGVLLMVNRAALNISGAFEGILGLGIPKEKAVMASLLQRLVHNGYHASGNQDPSDPWSICSVMPLLCDEQSPLKQTGGGMPDVPISNHPGQQQYREGDLDGLESYETKLFLEQAKVDRFSMCFRDREQTGALRLGLSSLSSPLQNIGKLHWGLNFQGVSVSAHGTSAPTETVFCGLETMKQGMETPCGIIPDSGTTLLMGPKEQVSALEAEICSKWERCQTYSKGMPSSKLFQELLLQCGDWLTEEKGLLEIPSFFFHVKSGDGKPEAFELTAWAWVTEMSMRDVDGSVKKACMSSIGPMDYLTQANGPVWIFGHPLFYEYNVGYDMSTKQISLQKGQCEPCSTEGGPVSLSDGGRRWPRAAHGEPRIPYYNVNLPL